MPATPPPTNAHPGAPPAGQPCVMHQRWQHLLFLHWRVPADLIQPHLPPGLTVETFDGSAWIGVVPFWMRRIRPRFLPCVPGLSDFLELNLRTYVIGPGGRAGGLPQNARSGDSSKNARAGDLSKNARAGVWFFSLECNQKLAVILARTLFKLPYRHAAMDSTAAIPLASEPHQSEIIDQKSDLHPWVDFTSLRRGSPPEHRCSFHYRARGPVRHATPGTLEHFLAERYRLYAWNPRRQRLGAGLVAHPPYPLHDVEVTAGDDTLLELNGLPRFNRPPDHAVCSPGVDVKIYPLRRIDVG